MNKRKSTTLLKTGRICINDLQGTHVEAERSLPYGILPTRIPELRPSPLGGSEGGLSALRNGLPLVLGNGGEDTAHVRAICESAMREYGVSQLIRIDNGAPFSGSGILGLSRLSLEWQRLGIVDERIQPGKPQQNGRHERMHQTLKQDTANPQARRFVHSRSDSMNSVASTTMNVPTKRSTTTSREPFMRQASLAVTTA